MTTINTVGSQPVFVPTEGVAPPATVASTAVQETPSTAPAALGASPSAVAPSLPPPAAKVDYAGAKSTMSAYTALIILVCETNRESYAANRTMSKAQMHTRVAELKDVAAKRKTAAIVGLVMGVISGAVGVAGGAVGIAGSAKNLKTLHSLPPPQNAGGVEKVGNTSGNQNTAQTDAQNTADTTAKGAVPDADAPLDRDVSLRGVEVESARLQSMSVLYGAFQSSLSTLGQSASGIVSSEADLMAADAEATENARQTTVSSMQQFQDLMGKFTQILSSLLEAENKARSAAAQA